MKSYNFKDSSLKQLKGMIKRVHDKKDTILVGTHVSSEMLDETILSEPFLELMPTKDKDSFCFKVSLKPLPSQLLNVNTWGNIITSTGIGCFSDDLPNEPNQKSTFAMDVTMTNGGLSNIQNYEVEFSMQEPEIKKAEVVIRGEKYQYFTVTDYYSLDTEDSITNTVHLVFKDKKMDLEGIFSSIRGKHSKLNTKKILDLIATDNVTPMSIGGLQVEPNRDKDLLVAMYPIESDIVLKNTGGYYDFVTNTGVITIPKENIVSSELEYVNTNKYTLILVTKDHNIRVFLG